MNQPTEKVPFAWQPFTPRGLAAFAKAKLGRLFLVQLVCAMLAAVSLVWFLDVNWFPVVSQAVGRLPEQGAIRAGRLDWRGESPAVLAEGPFLALTVDLKHEGGARLPAQVQVEFGERDLRVFSIVGFVGEAYPRGLALAFNRSELSPWWGAWVPAILTLAGFGAVVGLILVWALLATVYFIPVRVMGFVANRDLSWGGSWRLAAASLMPGALFITGAFVLYGLGRIDLVKLGIADVVHILIGWVYLVLAILAVPPQEGVAAEKQNPFSGGGAGKGQVP